MKVRTPSGTRDMRSVWWEGGRLCLIEQRLLPRTLKVVRLSTVEKAAKAIEDMAVRGAPAIGAAAAYGLALAKPGKLGEAAERLARTRPTARDLFRAIEYVKAAVKGGASPLDAADEYVETVVEACKRIGENGADLIDNGYKILTHCNAGALATVDYGTALAPMRVAKSRKKRFFVFADETRPRLQGAALTAWELVNEGIDHAVIADNAAGFFMANGEIDLVITGADRITRNGDAANKIGTYEKAVLAHENSIPFYIAAPMTTFDLSLECGDEIPIEERSEDEVLELGGKRVAAKGARARNPGFDVTPERYVSGYITEFGILKARDIAKLG
ncbi:MAG: S-methyl-5-thioribose-1-phosphate isomerase [Euryarchaeota archaeon]|nr:S-methyl-5-thioribose-1-phosphate isomerase [Euryarchaeota archaeon]